MKNWAGNYEYSTRNIHFPETIEQVQTLVTRCKKLRVLGTRHSFNSIADSTENLISLERLAPAIQLNHARHQATITANVTYAQLSRVLHGEQFALPNLGSLPHISVAGACATATHGSGDHNRNLAGAVSGLEIVTAEGELIALSRAHDPVIFEGAVVNLGGLGVVVRLTLDLLQTFEMRQYVYEKLPVPQLEAHFDEIMARDYSVSLFTDWQHDWINQVWVKQVHTDNSAKPQLERFEAVPASGQRHPIPELSGEQCTTQLGIPGPWHERLPHFRHDATPSAGDELQSEYFVPRKHAIEAFHTLSALSDNIAPHLLISEIRTIAADNLWMSPCYQRDSVAFHFTWKPDWNAVRELLPIIEAHLAPFEARPHWGKLFTMPPHQIQSLYPKLPEFQSLLQSYDPQRKFRNTFLDVNLFGN